MTKDCAVCLIPCDLAQKAIAKACGCGINTVRLRIEQWAGEQDRARTGAA